MYPHKPSVLSDQEILQRFMEDHDNEWIGILFSRYAHLLLGVCLKYLKDPENAKDSVQQIFLRILGELHRHQVIHFKAWIYQVSRNYCLMQLRSKRKFRVKTFGQLPEIMDNPEEDFRSEQLKDSILSHLNDAISQLPEGQKTCIVLFYMGKKSYQDIASETSLTLMQVKSHIQNGKRNLRILLDRMSLQDPK